MGARFYMDVHVPGPITEQLRRRGVDIVNPPFEIEDISARLAFFRDPWGNMFELSERVS